jgi:hypothetical protein
MLFYRFRNGTLMYYGHVRSFGPDYHVGCDTWVRVYVRYQQSGLDIRLEADTTNRWYLVCPD